MLYGDMPVFQALKHKMQWHQSRQSVLSENIANADTPGFQGSDLRALSFEDAMSVRGPGGVAARLTDGDHIEGALRGASPYRTDGAVPFEITPDGNEVAVEEQMMKVAGNQMDYQAATSLYSRSLGLIKTALGKQ